MIQTGKDAVAEVCGLWRPSRNPDDKEEEAANALLIASAPELLDNLQFLKAHMDRARAAIAKAKGKTA